MPADPSAPPPPPPQQQQLPTHGATLEVGPHSSGSGGRSRSSSAGGSGSDGGSASESEGSALSLEWGDTLATWAATVRVQTQGMLRSLQGSGVRQAAASRRPQGPAGAGPAAMQGTAPANGVAGGAKGAPGATGSSAAAPTVAARDVESSNSEGMAAAAVAAAAAAAAQAQAAQLVLPAEALAAAGSPLSGSGQTALAGGAEVEAAPGPAQLEGAVQSSNGAVQSSNGAVQSSNGAVQSSSGASGEDQGAQQGPLPSSATSGPSHHLRASLQEWLSCAEAGAAPEGEPPLGSAAFQAEPPISSSEEGVDGAQQAQQAECGPTASEGGQQGAARIVQGAGKQGQPAAGPLPKGVFFCDACQVGKMGSRAVLVLQGPSSCAAPSLIP
jgi:hypothetical protein